MRNMSLVVIGVLAAVPLVFGGASEEYYGYSYARMSYVQGDVYVQRTSDLGYEKGEVNLPVVEGDKIGTRDGQVEIHLGRRNYLRLDRNSVVDFVRLPRRDDDRINIHVLEGGVFLRVSELPVDKGIEAHTPDASVYVIEEGLYRIEARNSGESEFFAYEGSLEIAGEEGSVVLNAYKKMAVSNGRFLSDPVFFRAGSDGFEMWNADRDGLLQARTGSRHLPSEIYEYEDELDRSGRWVYERPYGYVWIPLHVQVDWRPYHYGRWVWYPVIGWTWVSSEPWGWSVYRYGRWHWRMGLGWYWIPTRYWGPAWVHWHWDAHYVAWSPLSYYNYPVVIINNRFYDRYHDRHYPVHSRALTVVHRSQLQSHAVHRNALRADRVSSLGAVNLRARQPDIRPSIDRSSAVSGVARNVLSKASVRPVERPSSAFGRSSPMPARRLSSPDNSSRSIRELRPSASPQGVSRGGNVVRNEEGRSDSGRIVRSEGANAGSGVRAYPSRSEAGSVRPSGSSGTSDSLNRLRGNSAASSPADGKRGETIKSYPPRSNLPSFGRPARTVSGREEKPAASGSSAPPSRVKKDPEKSSANQNRIGGADREGPRGSSPSFSRQSSTPSPRSSGTSSRFRIPERSSRIAAPSSSDRGSAARSLSFPSSGRSVSVPSPSLRSGSSGRSTSPSPSIRSGSSGRSVSRPSSSVRSSASSGRTTARSSSSGSSRGSGGPRKK